MHYIHVHVFVYAMLCDSVWFYCMCLNPSPSVRLESGSSFCGSPSFFFIPMAGFFLACPDEESKDSHFEELILGYRNQTVNWQWMKNWNQSFYILYILETTMIKKWSRPKSSSGGDILQSPDAHAARTSRFTIQNRDVRNQWHLLLWLIWHTQNSTRSKNYTCYWVCRHFIICWNNCINSVFIFHRPVIFAKNNR